MLILSDIGVLYDGNGAGDSAVHRHVDLFVDGGLIHEVKPHDPALAVGEAHTQVDASAWSVVPGLIDCHSHLTVLGLDGGSIDLMNTGEMLVWVEKILHTTLVDGGVTTARDVGGATHLMKRLVEGD